MDSKKINLTNINYNENKLFSEEQSSKENTMNLSKYREDKELISVVLT